MFELLGETRSMTEADFSAGGAQRSTQPGSFKPRTASEINELKVRTGKKYNTSVRTMENK